MVISTSDNLRALFENLKSVGFFGRLFRWHRILEINAAASAELTSLNNELVSLNDQNRQIKNQVRSVYQDLDHQKSLLSDLKSDYGIVKTSNLYMSQTIRDKEIEIGAFREADAKNTKRILELEKDTELFSHSMKLYIRHLEGNEEGQGDRNESDNTIKE